MNLNLRSDTSSASATTTAAAVPLEAIVVRIQKRAAMRQREIVFPNARIISERMLERIGEQLLHPDGRPLIDHALTMALDWAMAHQLQSEPDIGRDGHIAFVAGLLAPLAAIADRRFVAGPRHAWDLTSTTSLPIFLSRHPSAAPETVHRLDPLRDVDLLTLQTMTASRILTAGDVAAMGGSIQTIISWRPAHAAAQ